LKTQLIGAIDIGTAKVCSLIAETDGTGLRILGIGIAPSNGVQKGQVVNIGEATRAVSASVAAAEKTAGCRMPQAVISVTGKHVTSDNKRGVISITSNRKQTVLPGDVRRLLQISRSENIPSDQAVLHQIPRYYRVDGQDGVKDPVGMHGYRLDVETHTVWASLNAIENLAKCVSAAGVKIDCLVFEPLASGEAVLNEDEKRDGVLLVDIGGGTSNIAVYKDDFIFYSAVVPAAGNQITKDIAMGLGYSPEFAEELKLRHGSLIPPASLPNKPRQKAGEQEMPPGELFDIINIRAEELLRLIILQIKNDFKDLIDPATFLPAGMVITGGTANLPGLVDMAQQITCMPCRIGYPARVAGIADDLCDPAYAASLGLLIWKLQNPDVRYHQQVWTRKTGKGFFSRLIRAVTGK